jgi:hypothetical protein
MTLYWEFVVSKLPVKMAPNLITMIGFIVLLLVTIWSVVNVLFDVPCGRFELFVIITGIFFY